MRKLSVILLLLFGAASLFEACATTTTTDTQQDFANLVWKPDGSGMYGLFDRQLLYVTNTATNQYIIGIYNQTGGLIGTVPTTNMAVNPNFFVDSQNAHAVAELGANLYKVDLPSGNQTLLATKVRLFVASPDLHYAIVTPSPDGSPVRTISVLDIQSSPAREIKKWDVSQVSDNSGIWIKNGRFGLTVNNGGAQIDIFDTLGNLVDSVQTADQEFHNGNYVAATDDLYYRTGGNGVDRINLTTRAITHMFSTEAVDNFDVSVDGKTLAVNATSGISVINTQTLAAKFITNDAIYWGVFLSPTDDRLAYIHQSDGSIRDIHVLSFSLP